MLVPGSDYKYRWSCTHYLPLASCCAAWLRSVARWRPLAQRAASSGLPIPTLLSWNQRLPAAHIRKAATDGRCVLMSNAWAPNRSPSLQLWTPGRWLADTIREPHSDPVTHFWEASGKSPKPSHSSGHAPLVTSKNEITSGSNNMTVKDRRIQS